MKKVFLSAAVVVIAVMASCSKSDDLAINTGNPNIISFSPYVGKTTKASPMLIAGLQGQGFDAYANVTGSAFGTFFPGKLPLIYNQSTNEGTEVGGNGKWGYTGAPFYWINAATTLDFYAFSAEQSLTATGATGVVVPVIAATADVQEDILAAPKVTQSSGQVNFTFAHILSMVDFEITCGAGVVAEIVSFEIQGVSTSNTNGYSLTTDTWGAAASATPGQCYTYGGTAVFPKTITGATTPVSSGKFSTLGTTAPGAFMLLPQTYTTWTPAVAQTAGARIKITYHLQYDGTYVLGGTGTTKGTAVTAYFPMGGTGWAKGTSYLYTLALTKGGGGGYTDPDENPNTLPNDPLLTNTPILFGVTSITAWGTDTAVDVTP